MEKLPDNITLHTKNTNICSAFLYFFKAIHPTGKTVGFLDIFSVNHTDAGGSPYPYFIGISRRFDHAIVIKVQIQGCISEPYVIKLKHKLNFSPFPGSLEAHR